MRKGLFASTAVALGISAMLVGFGDAASAEVAPAQASGRVSLFSATNTATLTYDHCVPAAQLSVDGRRTRFDNDPLAGCQVVLISDRGTTFTLCAGTGPIPAAFQASPVVRVRSGSTVPCLAVP